MKKLFAVFVIVAAIATLVSAQTTNYADYGPELGDNELATQQKQLGVISGASKATITHATTSGADGTTWTAFPNIPCHAVFVNNVSGATINVRRNGGGDFMPVPTGTTYNFIGVANANQISIQRADTANTATTLNAEARN